MDVAEKDEIVSVYLKYLRWNQLSKVLAGPRDQTTLADLKARAEENPYADEIDLFGVIVSDPELAWELLLRIVAEAEETELYLLGAGDLEDFVTKHALNFDERIIEQIEGNARFRKAFESVYLGREMPLAVGRRFNDALRATGVDEANIIDWWGDVPEV